MALDKILHGILREFISKYDLNDVTGISRQYEYFINYLIISKYYPEAFSDRTSARSDMDTVIIDEKGQFGLDAAAFIINGNLVLSADDLDRYIKAKNVQAEIIFIQTKTEARIDSGDLLKEIEAVKMFLENPAELTEPNENVKNAAEIFNKLFTDEECTKSFRGSLPKCHVYYVTASTEGPNALIKRLCKTSSSAILERFGESIQDCDIHVIGHEYVTNLYRELNNSVSAAVNLETCQRLNDIKDVNSAYIGYLRAEEYLKIICTPEGELRRYIFYENVRDYQGADNSVNQEIRSTLQDADTHGQFVVLNNGITIITKDMQPLARSNYMLSGFQIVNGCQTSNEIYNERENISDVLVPIRIIHTSDTDLIARIIRAANRQTAVPKESFISLDTFHKNLQLMMNGYSKDMPIEVFYERRSGEQPPAGNFHSGFQTITLHGVTRAVESVFFQRPDIVAKNNPANILDKGMLFSHDHVQEAYFTACYLVVVLADLCKKKVLDHDAYILRHYIVMAVWMLMNKNISKTDLNDKHLKKQCESIIAMLKGDCTEYYTTAFEIVSMTKGDERFAGAAINQILRKEDFVHAVIRNVEIYLSEKQ